MNGKQAKEFIRGVIMASVLSGTMGSTAVAQITRIEITSRSEMPTKAPNAIPYEVIKGHLFGELDPRDSHNTIVQDLDLAPLNERGHAEYTTTFTLTRPLDQTRSSHVLVYAVVNRGADFLPQDHTSGDTYLTSGWQGDRPFGGKSIMGTPGESIRVPVAQGVDGKAITGRVLARFPDVAPGTSSLALAAALGYVSSGTPPTPNSLDSSQATLTFRTFEDQLGVQSKVETIGSSDWAWGDCTHDPFPGKPSDAFICIKGGFRTDGLYQLEYTAKDPLILGMGLTAIRDTVSFFRYEAKALDGVNPIAGEIKHAIAIGVSQSGNAIRTFLNLGMNEDVHGRIVWDGVMPIIASRQTPVNLRFAIPGGATGLYEPGSDGVLWWTDWPDEARKNPTSSLLHRCNLTDTCPKVVEVLGSSEFYSLRASANFVGTSAKVDIPLPKNVRRYYVASTQHGGGTGGFNWQPVPPPPQMSFFNLPSLLPANPNSEEEIIFALFFALKEWVAKGIEPPPSNYPTLQAGELAPEAHVLASFPNLLGTPAPRSAVNPTVVYDFGPRFRANDVSGIMDTQPPVVKGAIPSVLPTLDADGNEVGGVRTVLLQAPLGTYLGWNIVSSGFFKGQFCPLAGGYVPFARTRLDRERQHDPRLSLEERYHDHTGYVAKVRLAANDLVERRLLLQHDADRLIREAEASSVLLP